MDIIEDIKSRLKDTENIKSREHAGYRINIRSIDKDLIIRNLRNPKNLIKVVLEKDKYPGEKYELYFRLNKRKSLKVVISFLNKDLYVITTHIISIKRLKLVEKWRKEHT